jgi:hypothetical protein
MQEKLKGRILHKWVAAEKPQVKPKTHLYCKDDEGISGMPAGG